MKLVTILFAFRRKDRMTAKRRRRFSNNRVVLKYTPKLVIKVSTGLPETTLVSEVSVRHMRYHLLDVCASGREELTDTDN
jgi:hypothetical protein